VAGNNSIRLDIIVDPSGATVGVDALARAIDSSIQYASQRAVASFDGAISQIVGNLTGLADTAGKAFSGAFGGLTGQLGGIEKLIEAVGVTIEQFGTDLFTSLEKVSKQLENIDLLLDRIAKKRGGGGGTPPPPPGNVDLDALLAGQTDFSPTGRSKFAASKKSIRETDEYRSPLGQKLNAISDENGDLVRLSQGFAPDTKGFEQRQRIDEYARLYAAQDDERARVQRIGDANSFLFNNGFQQTGGRVTQSAAGTFGSYQFQNASGSTATLDELAGKLVTTFDNSLAERAKRLTAANSFLAAGGYRQTGYSFSQANDGSLNRVLQYENAQGETAKLDEAVGRLTGQFAEAEKSSGGFFSSIARGYDALGRFSLELFGIINVFERIGGAIQRFLIDPLVDFGKRILDATDRYRSFESSIAGVAGGPGRARAIDQGIQQYARTSPLTVSELQESGRALAFTRYGAARVSGASPGEAAQSISEYGTLLNQLELLAPETGIQGAGIAVREALAGNFQSARRRLNVAPEQIASTIGKSLRDINGDESLTFDAFKRYADIYIGSSAFQSRSSLFSVSSAKLSDSVDQGLVGIGNAGFYDKIVARFRGITETILDYINGPNFGNTAKQISNSLTRLFDSIGDTVLRFLERLTGSKTAVDSLGKAGDAIAKVIDLIAQGVSYLPDLADAVGEFFRFMFDLGRKMADYINHPENLGGDIASGAAKKTAISVATSAVLFPLAAKKTYDDYQAPSGLGGFAPALSFALAALGAAPVAPAPAIGPAPAFSQQRFDDAVQRFGQIGQHFEEEDALRSRVLAGIGGAQTRPLAQGLAEIVGRGAVLPETAGAGGQFSFDNDAFSKLVQAIERIPGDIAKALPKDRDTNLPLAYSAPLPRPSLLSAAKNDLFNVRLRAGDESQPLIDQVTQATSPAGIISGQFGQTNFRDVGGKLKVLEETVKDYEDRLTAITSLPDQLVIKLQAVGGELADQLDRLSPSLAHEVADKLASGNADLADGISDSLHLPDDLREKLHRSITDGPTKVTEFINKAIYDAQVRYTQRGNLVGSAPKDADIGNILAARPASDRETNQNLRNLAQSRLTQLSGEYVSEQNSVNPDRSELAKLKDSILDVKDAIRQLDEALDPLQKAFKEFAIQTRSSLEDGVGGAFKNLITGVGSFHDVLVGFANDIVSAFSQMLAKLAVQGLVGDFLTPQKSGGLGGLGGLLGGAVKGVGNLLGFAGAEGGIIPGHFSPLPFRAFADGGMVHQPTLGLVGEAGYPEAIIPLKTGAVPVEFRGAPQQAGGRTYILAKDESDAASKGYRPGTDDLVAVENYLAGSVASGTGPLARTMRKLR
jgi:hypothetical protein